MKKNELFLELARPNSNGVSRVVYASEFVGKYTELITLNGGSWTRREAPLAKKYKIVKTYKKHKTHSFKLVGFNNVKLTKSIPSSIYTHFKGSKCALLYTSKIEIDHKNGRYGEIDTKDTNNYQPLSKAANDAKRQHCKVCVRTEKRFDAKLIGYSKSFSEGDSDYKGTCKGCFWYDIHSFNKSI